MDKTADAIEWWAGIGGQALGPLSPAEVRARWEAGEITPSTLVWRAGFAEWRPAGEVPELAAVRPTSTPAPVWKPHAGSALAALAGAELAGLEGPADGSRAASVQSGSPRFDLLTNPGGTAQRNDAVPSASVTSSRRAIATPRPPEEPAAASTAPRQDVAAGRRSALLAGAGTFAMGAAVAVALLLVFRDGGDRPATNHAAAAPSPATPAAAVASAPTTPSQPPEAPPAAAQPAGNEKLAAGPQVAAPATTDAPEESRANVVRGPVQAAAPVRTSDPPPAATAPPARERRAAKPATSQREVKQQAVVARRSPPPRKAEKPAPRASEPLAMAAPARDPAPAGPPAAEPKPAARDPLANLVTDADLDRELGGGSANKSGQAAAEPSRNSAQDAAPARTAAAAVYVPPAPGSDLPENVSAAQINEAVKTRMAALRSCIEEQRAVDPAAKGTLKLRWVIGGDGNVKEVRNLSPEYEGKPISRCISGVVREIRFPTSRTAGQEVVFPFKF